MTPITWKQYGRALAVLAAGVIALILVPSHGMAFSTCATLPATLCENIASHGTDSDCDMDGITLQDECFGFTTSAYDSANNLHIAGFDQYDPNNPNNLNPTKPDLFYALTSTTGVEVGPTSESIIYGALESAGQNALAFYADDVTGLKVSTHRISLNNAGGGRVLFPAAAASKARLAWIKESLCVSTPNTPCEGTYLGSTPESVPTDDIASTTIYSQKIQNDVYSKCVADGACSVAMADGTVLTARDDIVNYYILQVISHEMGHGSLLGAKPATIKSNYHYSRSDTVMDPSVTYSKGVYIIPVKFAPGDAGAARLVR